MSSSLDPRRRAELCEYSHRMHARGWVANHDGNLSVRCGDGRYLCTPTATSKAEVTPDSLLTVDESGARVSGTSKPFSEIGLHMCIYKKRPDVQAVVHAHPPHATALAACGRALEQPFLAEAVVSLGPVIPLVPVSAPGPAAVAQLEPYISAYDVVLVAGNGVIAWGDSIEQAYLRLELCEHLSRITLLAQPLGGPKPLPAALLPALLEARRRAGLGPEGRGEKAPVAAAPAPSAAPTASPPAGSDHIAALIRQEIANALKRT
jgi:L-fuculose-phosphate aldolase